MASVPSLQSATPTLDFADVEGHAVLSLASPCATWGGLGTCEVLELEVATPQSPPRSRAPAAPALRNRRTNLRQATLTTDLPTLNQALATLTNDHLRALRLWLDDGGLRLGAEVRVGNRTAAVSTLVSIEPRADGRRRVRLALGDIRLYGHLPLPGPLVGMGLAQALARACARGLGTTGSPVRARGACLELDPLDLALLSTLVADGWRLPDLGRAWLEGVEASADGLRLRFIGDGHPTDRLPTLEQRDESGAAPSLGTIEGESVPEALAVEEAALAAGRLTEAEGECRRLIAADPGEWAAWARLLALRTATLAPDAVTIAAEVTDRFPDLLPGWLAEAVIATERGDAATARRAFDRVAELADARGEQEDAALARRARDDVRDVAPDPTISEDSTDEPSPWPVAELPPIEGDQLPLGDADGDGDRDASGGDIAPGEPGDVDDEAPVVLAARERSGGAAGKGKRAGGTLANVGPEGEEVDLAPLLDQDDAGPTAHAGSEDGDAADGGAEGDASGGTPGGAATSAVAAELAALAAATEDALNRGDLEYADACIAERLDLVTQPQQKAELVAERARVKLMTPGGAPDALAMLRTIPIAEGTEEGLVLRADLAERLGELDDVRAVLGELAVRASQAGDSDHVRDIARKLDELAALAEGSGPHSAPHPVSDGSREGELGEGELHDGEASDHEASHHEASHHEASDLSAAGGAENESRGKSPAAAAPTDQPGASGPDPAEPEDVTAEAEEPDEFAARMSTLYATEIDPRRRVAAVAELVSEVDALSAPASRARAFVSLGRIAEAASDLAHAEPLFWRAVQASGAGDDLAGLRADALVAHARALLADGNAAVAMPELDEAVRLVPDHAEALAVMAEEAFAGHEWTRARQLYERLAQTPGVSDVLPEPALLARTAALARMAGDAASATEAYTRLAALAPAHVEARQALAELAAEHGDEATAAQRWEEVLRLLPASALGTLLSTREQLGRTYLGLGELGRARHYFEMVVAHDPERVEPLEQLGDVYEGLRQFKEAAATHERLSRLYGEARPRAEALYRQGELLRANLGDEDAAFDAYLKSSDLDRTFAPTAVRLVDAFWRLGEYADAVDVAGDLRQDGTLPILEPITALRLALATELSTRGGARARAIEDLTLFPWDPTLGAAVFAETAAPRGKGSPAHAATLARALEFLAAWRAGGAGGATVAVDETRAELAGQLRASAGAAADGPGHDEALAFLEAPSPG